jgi:hypothetical protein
MALSYEERLRRYERDKQELLRKFGWLPAAQFEAKLQRLIKKWRI